MAVVDMPIKGGPSREIIKLFTMLTNVVYLFQRREKAVKCLAVQSEQEFSGS